MVIRHVAKATDPFSRESRLAKIKRTEKQLHEKSPWLGTSVKKLVHLSRQIAGKTVEDALVQMRYSKKKMAKEIAYQLELARDRAVVERGMGLGAVKAQSENAPEEGQKVERRVVQQIKTKDGKHIEIEDPTKLYIAQSWVERGPLRGYRKSPRARGRMDLIKKPSTSEFSSSCRCNISWSLTLFATRYLGPPQGAEDADPRARGEGAEEVSPGALGTSSKQAYHGSTTALFVVKRELAPNG